MKNEDLYDAMTEIRSDLIDGASKTPARKKSTVRKAIMSAAAVLVVAAVAIGVLLMPKKTPNAELPDSPISYSTENLGKYTIIEAKYPKMAPYPDEMSFVDKLTGEFDDEAFYEVYQAWRDDVIAQRDQPQGYNKGLDAFTALSAAELLAGTDGENRVYSPLNIYIALGMLAEVTEGNSRQQILDLLGADDIDTLRSRADALWNMNYCDDSATISVPAGSIWLSNNLSYNEQTCRRLAETYHASSFSGEMGGDEFNSTLRDWLNSHTDGLLSDQIGDLGFNPTTVLGIATTLNFRAKWAIEYWKDSTEKGIFHSAKGDTECDFMHQSGTNTYYWGEKFSAVDRRLENSGYMRFILPDEGVTPEELLTDAETMRFMRSREIWENNKFLVVNEAVPKFDISAQFDLCDSLRALGMTDVFDRAIADFSPLLSADSTNPALDIFLSDAKHGARVMIDEEGCTAVAYAVMVTDGAAMPPDDEVDFILDRPFIFEITGYNGDPLFIGIVNNVG